MSGEFSLRQELHVLETMNRSKKQEIEKLRAELEKIKAEYDQALREAFDIFEKIHTGGNSPRSLSALFRDKYKHLLKGE